MSTDLVTQQTTSLAPKATPQQIAELEAVAKECQVVNRDVMPEFQKTFALAAAKRRLTELITPEMMQDIMQLQGSHMGFTTDLDQREGRSYPVAVVKEVAIEAAMRGLRLFNNEITVISSRLYAGKNGLRRLVQEFPGLEDLRIDVRNPEPTKGGVAMVPCKASYTLDGEPKFVDCMGNRAIPVRVNEKQIVDATIGKATRKLFARIYDGLTGMEHGLVESDEEERQAATEAATEAAKDGVNRPTEAQVREHYLGVFAKCETPSDVTMAQKAAASSGKRDTAEMKIVNDLASERRKQLKNGAGEGPSPWDKPEFDLKGEA